MAKHRASDGVYTSSAIEDNRRTSIPELMRDLGPVVYYLRVGDLVKVGFTTDLAARLRHYPAETKLLAWRMNGSFDMEREICQRLRTSVDHGREWFRPTTDVIAEVNAAREACGITKYLTAA